MSEAKSSRNLSIWFAYMSDEMGYKKISRKFGITDTRIRELIARFNRKGVVCGEPHWIDWRDRPADPIDGVF